MHAEPDQRKPASREAPRLRPGRAADSDPANLLCQSLRVGPPKSVTLMLFDLDTHDLRQIRPNHEREFLT
jgi:hypothetical protein